MAIVTVLGAGMMGSALCVPLADRGHEVRLVGTALDGEIIESLASSGVHPKLKLEMPAAIRYASHQQLEEAMRGSDALVLGVSSAGIGWARTAIAPHMRADLPVAMITKGLAQGPEGLEVLPDVVAAGLAEPLDKQVAPAAVAGPCIAGELARRVPSCVVVTGRDHGVLERFAALLTTDYYHVFISDDVIGTEASAALKNAYAMAVAFGAGMHERRGGEAGSVAMHNFESAIFAQSIFEMQRIVGLMGGRPESVAGLAGVGDLDVTNNGGRTGRFGRLLGSGLSVSQAQERMAGATLECLEIIAVMRVACRRWQTAGRLPEGGLPLMEHMAEVVLDGAEVGPPLAQFFR